MYVMAAPDPVPSARKRRRTRNGLGRDDIVAAARRVLHDTDGRALTMRAVADALGASPMALYTHVRSKEEIVDAAVDDLLGELALVDDIGMPPADVLVGFALRHIALLRAEPWAIPALLARPDPGPNAADVGEAYLGVAFRAGADDRGAVDLFTGILAVVYGVAGFLAPTAAPAAGQSADEIAERIIGHTVGRAATARAASELADFSDESRVRRLVSGMVTGLAASRG